jgi:hypothetical protein
VNYPVARRIPDEHSEHRPRDPGGAAHENASDDPGNGSTGYNSARKIATAVELAIDTLIDGPVSRHDPVMIERQRAHLVVDAQTAATTLIEVMVHGKLAAARGVQLTVDDPPVDAHAGAMVALHQATCRYTHATRLQDALEVADAVIEA